MDINPDKTHPRYSTPPGPAEGSESHSTASSGDDNRDSPKLRPHQSSPPASALGPDRLPVPVGSVPPPEFGAENFILRIKRTVPASPRGSAPGPDCATAPSARSSAPADSGLNNCTAPDLPPTARARPLDDSRTLAKARQDDRVYASDLSDKMLAIANAGLGQGATVKAASLGALLVAVDSKGGKLKLEGDRITRILRGGLKIQDFQPASGAKACELNIVETLLQPFMRLHLGGAEMDHLRKTVWKAWQEAERAGSPKASVKDSAYDPQRDPFDKAIQPVMEFICGPQRTLGSSTLPKAVKDLLLAIDMNIIGWFQSNGTGKESDLFRARLSALIGFLSTRSLGFVWLEKLSAETSADPSAASAATRLIQYLNSHVASQIDDFLRDIIRSQESQPVATRRYLGLVTGDLKLQSKLSSAAFGPASSGTDETSWSRLLSPRGLSRQVEGRQAKEKQMKDKLERANYADQFARQIGLDELDYACFQYLKEKLITMPRRAFDNVKSDPAKYAMKYVEEFYSSSAKTRAAKSAVSAEVKAAIAKISRDRHPDLFSSSSDEDEGSHEETSSSAPQTPRIQASRSDSDSSDSKIDSVDDDDED